jgi:hypothetical protein
MRRRESEGVGRSDEKIVIVKLMVYRKKQE